MLTSTRRPSCVESREKIIHKTYLSTQNLHGNRIVFTSLMRNSDALQITPLSYLCTYVLSLSLSLSLPPFLPLSLSSLSLILSLILSLSFSLPLSLLRPLSFSLSAPSLSSSLPHSREGSIQLMQRVGCSYHPIRKYQNHRALGSV